MAFSHKTQFRIYRRKWPILVTALSLASVFQIGHVFGQESGERESVAIVIHRDVDIENVTINELRRIFLADQQFWPDKSRIVLLIREPETHERKIVLERIYQMTEGEFRRYWIAKVFRAEIPSGPKVVLSANMARDLVSVIPNSITFMRLADVEPEFKVISIDGKMPDDDGYALNFLIP